MVIRLDGSTEISSRWNLFFFSFQHETLSENVIGTFGAQVEVHDTKMYIFSPAVSVASI